MVLNFERNGYGRYFLVDAFLVLGSDLAIFGALVHRRVFGKEASVRYWR
jgi:hypothetical protein